MPEELPRWYCSMGLSYSMLKKWWVVKTAGRNIVHVHCTDISLTSFVLRNWGEALLRLIKGISGSYKFRQMKQIKSD